MAQRIVHQNKHIINYESLYVQTFTRMQFVTKKYKIEEIQENKKKNFF